MTTSTFLLYKHNQLPSIYHVFGRHIVKLLLNLIKLSCLINIFTQYLLTLHVQLHHLAVNISTSNLFQILCDMDPNKASGIDEIGPALLKNCAESLTTPYILYIIYVLLSLKSQSLPQEWRIHCVIPIFKSGDKTLLAIANYTSISLLCLTQGS